ncbi:hypothetical protein GQ54DRAFT_299039 [Martensiomyces pterosporus]|nr:hypothetical protein GQ54DRAFT_299039 [Martensiomyces pterosporus]
MCGIQVLIQRNEAAIRTRGEKTNYADIWSNLTKTNSRRGPDSHRELAVTLPSNNASDPAVNVTFGAHVLHLRGPHTERQPISDEESGDVFCWNGEVFAGLDVRAENDGRKLFDRIQALKKDANECNYILRAFSEIEGPYAFVYLDRQQKKLWFARDFLGRRSLLVKRASPDALFISSVADGTDTADATANTPMEGIQGEEQSEGSSEWTEILAQKIYCLDLDSSSPTALAPESTVQYDWHYSGDEGAPEQGSCLALPFDRVNLELASSTSPESDSGARLPVENCDLSAFPEIHEWQPYVDRLKEELSAAIRERVESIPTSGCANDPRVGILFSGGVDCITIAALLTSILPKSEPIELFNVAFENPRQVKARHTEEHILKHKKGKGEKEGGSSASARSPAAVPGDTKSIYDVPDRKTGRQGWLELCRIDPEREWRFVEVDVPYSDVLAHKPHIRQLLAPSDTVMDMSIGMAIWFASRGVGSLAVPVDTKCEGRPTGTALFPRKEYTGMARVLLLGMGADEQLGGYSRHRSAWERGGWQELGQEIRVDVQRIASRNLGRDDRIVSDSSKESRYPFLAANVVRFLSSAPLDRKMDMRYPRGYGEKLLLRLLAYQLGLTGASTLAKRAIQFGARTAKMESGHTKGHNRL